MFIHETIVYSYTKRYKELQLFDNRIQINLNETDYVELIAGDCHVVGVYHTAAASSGSVQVVYQPRSQIWFSLDRLIPARHLKANQSIGFDRLSFPYDIPVVVCNLTGEDVAYFLDEDGEVGHVLSQNLTSLRSADDLKSTFRQVRRVCRGSIDCSASACAIVDSRLNYCNELLAEISGSTLDKLQRIQNCSYLTAFESATRL